MIEPLLAAKLEYFSLTLYPEKRRKLAVMVLVMGESYGDGGSSHLDGSVLASVGHVVVVTFNFRLGALGNGFCHH